LPLIEIKEFFMARVKPFALATLAKPEGSMGGVEFVGFSGVLPDGGRWRKAPAGAVTPTGNHKRLARRRS
jgi:hypothetical protein